MNSTKFHPYKRIFYICGMKKATYTLIALCLCLNAQAYYPPIQNFSKNTYKAGAKNWDITQSPAGNIWVANDMGILEYDGLVWTMTPAANRTSVRSLYYDEQYSELYFGAVNEFGCLKTKNRSDYNSLIDLLGQNTNDIWQIIPSDKGLWIRENTKMFLLNGNNCTEFKLDNKITASECINGTLYIYVNGKGVLQFNGRDRFVAVPGTSSLKDKEVCSILHYGQDLVFVCSQHGLYKLHGDTLTSEEFGNLGRDLRKSVAYCAASNGEYYAFGTINNGIYIIGPDGEYIHLNSKSGLQNNTVLSLYFDKQHNLWAGLDKGISLIELSSPEYSLLTNDSFIGAGYASEFYDGKLWLGSNRGLFQATYKDSCKNLQDSDFKEYSPISFQVWALLNHDNTLFCSSDKGIYIITPASTRHIAMNGTWKLMPIRSKPGYILGCSYDRLFLLKKINGRWDFYKWIEDFDESSKVFEEDSDGSIWFSHWLRGLHRLRINYDTAQVLDDQFMSMGNGFPRDWGNVPTSFEENIIFSTDAGFYTFDKYTNRVHPFDALNNLFVCPPKSSSVFTYKDGDMFFAANKQIICYKTANKAPTRDILLNSGQEIMDFTVDSLSLGTLTSRRISGFEDVRELENELLLINTEDGFSIIDKKKIKNRKDRPDVESYVREISVLNKGRDSVIFQAFHKTENSHIVLPYKHNFLKFRVSQPVYGMGTDILFSFKLKGYDKDWSEFKASAVKEYTKLPAGKYTFQIMSNIPAISGSTSSDIEIEIERPWYLTWWAIVLYAILITSFVVLIVYITRIIIERRAAVLQKQKDEATANRQMRHELKMKADDLATSTMNLIRKNEILRQINTDLQSIADDMVTDRNKSLKTISKARNQIQENISLDNNWKKFEQNFDVVYEDFLKKMEEKHPNLTPTDKKLCAYLKMGLSSKEIAPLLNITVRSVEMNRYRVRKKIGLAQGESLSDYINKI